MLHLGHFLFTQLLLPILLATAKDEGQARVINTSSYSHTAFPQIDFNTLKDSPARRKLSPELLYGQSKFVSMFFHVLYSRAHRLQIQILFTQELAKRFKDQGIVSISLHPGVISGTEGTRHFPPALQWALVS